MKGEGGRGKKKKKTILITDNKVQNKPQFFQFQEL
jgi:hypothetical protein